VAPVVLPVPKEYLNKSGNIACTMGAMPHHIVPCASRRAPSVAAGPQPQISSVPQIASILKTCFLKNNSFYRAGNASAHFFAHAGRSPLGEDRGDGFSLTDKEAHGSLKASGGVARS
jgi:hypothetical protein